MDPNRWVADRRPPAPSAGVERLTQRTFKPPSFKLQWLMLGSVPCIESCVSLEQPKELRPCLTGVATRPPAAILSRTVCLEYPGTRSTLRDKNMLTCSGVPYIQTKSMTEAGLRLAITGEVCRPPSQQASFAGHPASPCSHAAACLHA